MGEKEELLMELNRVKYRNNMLGIIEGKLLQMKEIAAGAIFSVGQHGTVPPY
jgi:hypothetical protein